MNIISHSHKFLPKRVYQLPKKPIYKPRIPVSVTLPEQPQPTKKKWGWEKITGMGGSAIACLYFGSEIKEAVETIGTQSFKMLFEEVVKEGVREGLGLDTKSTEKGRYHIPLSSSLFSGRAPEIQSIMDFFQTSSEMPVALITGAPASGKTQLAIQCAHSSQSIYDQTRYVRLDQLISERSSVEGKLTSLLQFEEQKNDYLSFAKKPNLCVLDGIDDRETYEIVLRCLNKKSKTHVLLVGRFSPLSPTFYQFEDFRKIVLNDLSEKTALEIIEKAKKLSKRNDFSSEGLTELKNQNGCYNAALLISAIDCVFASGNTSFTGLPLQELYKQSRPNYPSLKEVYSSISGTNNSNFFQTIYSSKKENGLKLFESNIEVESNESNVKALNKLAENSLVSRVSGSKIYRMDESLHRYLFRKDISEAIDQD